MQRLFVGAVELFSFLLRRMLNFEVVLELWAEFLKIRKLLTSQDVNQTHYLGKYQIILPSFKKSPTKMPVEP